MTTVKDTIMYADGTFATGEIVVTWPPFQSGTVTIIGGQGIYTVGSAGAISIPLYPSVGATPATAYYTVNYQLDRGPVYTEYWAVPQTPTVVAIWSVRTVPGLPT